MMVGRMICPVALSAVLTTRVLDGLAMVYEDALVLEPDNPAEPQGGGRRGRAEGRAVDAGPAWTCPAGGFADQEERRLIVGKEALPAAFGTDGICLLNAPARVAHAGGGGNRYGCPGEEPIRT